MRMVDNQSGVALGHSCCRDCLNHNGKFEHVGMCHTSSTSSHDVHNGGVLPAGSGVSVCRCWDVVVAAFGGQDCMQLIV